METLHLASLATHIGAGSVAMLIGFVMLARAKGTARHRAWGRVFGALALVVCATATLGTWLFRPEPLLAVLSATVLYQLVGGWRAVYTRERGPGATDALWTLCGLAAGGALALWLPDAPGTRANPTVSYATLSALLSLVAYDLARWTFPRHWHARLWRYEHAYKLIAAQFAMLSALTGNLVRFWYPWPQLLPSVAGLVVIAWTFWRLAHPRPTPQAQ